MIIIIIIIIPSQISWGLLQAFSMYRKWCCHLWKLVLPLTWVKDYLGSLAVPDADFPSWLAFFVSEWIWTDVYQTMWFLYLCLPCRARFMVSFHMDSTRTVLLIKSLSNEPDVFSGRILLLILLISIGLTLFPFLSYLGLEGCCHSDFLLLICSMGRSNYPLFIQQIPQ